MSTCELYPPPAESDPRAETLVIYHAHCGDGFTAAWAAWRAFGNRAQYLPADHACRPIVNVRGRRVFVLDFAFPRDTLQEMAAQAEQLVLLDHHRSAAEDLRGLPFAHVDESKCGALLAWEHFHPHLPVPVLVRHVNERDLGRWRLLDSRAYLAWIEGIPRTFRNWDRLARMREDEYRIVIKLGAQQLAQDTHRIRELARSATPLMLFSMPALAVRCPPSLVCEVGPLLAKRCGAIGLCWAPLSGDRVQVSVRAVAGVDVSALARRFGGGGHAHAAGFVIPAGTFQTLLAQDAA
jgi:oligoribonuclease NrnB/cAMP/cGMP phosphodiesterase (DHH superfamily)